VRDYATEHLADENAVLVIDEIGFLKQGKASCGVAPSDAKLRAFRRTTAIANVEWDINSMHLSVDDGEHHLQVLRDWCPPAL
jgi:hypothetical protein